MPLPQLRSWAWPVACALLLAAPLALVAMPPMVDFPAHEAVVGVLRHWRDPAYFPPELYVSNPGHPNQLQYLLAWPASYLVGTTTALELVVALAVVATVLGAARLATHLGRSAWVCALVAPVVLGWNLQWGHIANLLGLGALLWALPALDRFAASPSWRRLPGVLAWLLLLYLAHEGVMFVAMFASVLFAAGHRGRPAQIAFRLLPAALATVVALAQLRMQKLTLVNQSYLVGMPFLKRVLSIPPVVAGYHETTLFLFGIAAFALLLNASQSRPSAARDGGPAVPQDPGIAGRARAFAARQRYLLLGACLLAAYFVLPTSYNGVFYFCHRFLPMAWCVFAVALAPAPAAPRERLCRLVTTAVPFAMLLSVAPDFAASDAAYRQLDRLAQSVTKNSAVYSVELEGGFSGAFNQRGFSARNAQGHVVARRGGRALADYTQSPIALALVRPDLAWQALTSLNFIRPEAFYPGVIFRRFRYLVLHVSSPILREAAEFVLQKEARVVGREPEWLLFESSILEASLTDPEVLPYRTEGQSFVRRLQALAESEAAAPPSRSAPAASPSQPGPP